MEPKAHLRINYLDWLRVLGILLVFVYHTTRLYNVEDWVVKNNVWYPSVEVWNAFVTPFMMPLMFVISGASLFYALGKGGFGKFLKDKVLRLLVPLLVGDLTASSLQAYLYDEWHGLFAGSYLQYLPEYYHLNTIHWLGDHLWYLLALFVFSVLLYPLMRWLRGGGSRILSIIGGALSWGGVVYVLALPIVFFHLLIPSTSLLMQGPGGCNYITYFWFTVLGFFVVSDPRLQDRIRQMRWISLVAGLALVVGFTAIVTPMAKPIVVTPAFVVAGLMRIFGSWLVVLAILGLGMQYLTGRSARLEYANEAVLPFYILHQTVIVTVGFFVVRWPMSDLEKWLFIFVTSFAAILGLYELLIRRNSVLRFMFGMKPVIKARQSVPVFDPSQATEN